MGQAGYRDEASQVTEVEEREEGGGAYLDRRGRGVYSQ